MMRLDVSAYEVPTDEPESDGTLEWDSTTIVLVEVSRGGVTGLGYTYGPEAIGHFVESELEPVVRGADAMSPQATWAAMQAAIRNAGRPGIGAMAISAVDIALWDLKAKLLGLCLADLLGTVHDDAPIYGSGGFTSYSDARLAEQLAGWVEMGIPRVKIKVGREPERDLHRMQVARQAIGGETELYVDANGAFDRKRALLWAERYAELGVTYLEEPVSSEDREGLRLLRDHGPAGLAIAAGEYAWTLAQLADLTTCVDVLQADVTRCGGITSFQRADGISEGAQLPLSIHCAPTVAAHAGCSARRLAHIEYFHDHARVEGLLFDGTLDPSGGTLSPNRYRLGLGIELKRSDAERFAA